MYTMKQACEKTGLTYETLKFYCNQGLAPNVKRDSQNRRVFDDRDIAWIGSLTCLKNCGMSIQQMREYLELCLRGQASIPQRKAILAGQRDCLEREIARIQASIDYIDHKQRCYEDVLSGKTPYRSNLLPTEE